MVLSSDQQNDPDVIAMIGASAALNISSMPFTMPLAAARVGYVEEKLVLNPTDSELEYSEMDMLVAGHKDSVNMIEVGAGEPPSWYSFSLL